MKLYLQACAIALSVVAAAQAIAQPLPGFEQVRTAYIPSDALLLDRHGEPLADLRLDPQGRRLDWTSLRALSPAMREALLAAEDKRFFKHSGIDWMAFVGAAWQNLWGTRRGGSTLTMQLAGLLEPTLRMPTRSRRSIGQKWDQSVAALEMERQWSKEQILEAYLNLAPFRGDVEGIGAASQILFDVRPEALTHTEATLLAALLRGPNAKPAVVARRACALAQVLKQGRLCPEISKMAHARLDLPRNKPRYALAPHLARQVLRQPGQKTTTTLVASVQRSALEAVKEVGANTATVVLDNTNGEVLAWVGAADPQHADGIIQRNSLPDWWVPFAVGVALERRVLTPASVFNDVLATYDPAMARPAFSLRTVMSARYAPALPQVASEAGFDPVMDRLRQLGFEAPASLDSQISAEVTLAQFAAAWRSLNNGGSYVPARFIRVENGVRKVWRTETTFVLNDMLASWGPEGWRTQWFVASGDQAQNMLVGATDRYTIAVVGSGPASAAATRAVWQQLASTLHKEPSRAPQVPDSLVSDLVVFEPPIEPPRKEWFLKGPEQRAELKTERYKRH